MTRPIETTSEMHGIGVAEMARVAAKCLKQARANSDHETGDLAEADMATAVRVIWETAGQKLRQSILATVTAEDGQ